MPDDLATSMRHRMRVRFAEADVEIGFSLVDMAEAEALSGDFARAAQILADAENIFLDIQQICAKLSDRERDPFLPLLGELRRAIGLARLHIASPH
jgi:hypothetical protein